MYCRFCGAELKPSAHFCTKCGQSADGTPAAQTPLVKNCKECGAALKEGAGFCGKCGEKTGANNTSKATVVPTPPSNIATVLRKPQTILWGHTILSIGYVLYLIISFVDAANNIYNTTNPFAAMGNIIAVGLSAQLIKPHLVLMAIAAVFSVLGVFMKRPWTYLTSAIIQTVGTAILLGVLLAIPLWLILMIVIIVLGFVAYSQLKKAT